MDRARKIMKKRAFMKAYMDSILPKEQSDDLWKQATDRLAGILERYSSLSGGVRTHTDTYIFPSAAIYLTAKEAVGRDTALAIIEDPAARMSESVGRKLAALMRVPGMKGTFVRLWDPLVKKVFGTKSGFTNRFYPKKKGEYRMDILSCPYCRYFTELGCPELTRIYCENDERLYGSLPGLRFARSGTLGKGSDRCDFYLYRE